LFSAVDIFCPDHGGKSYRKKIPQSMRVQNLIGLAQRLFNTGTEIPKLVYIDSKVRYSVLYEDLSLLRYNAMLSVESHLMFWRNMLPPSSGLKSEPNKKPA
jgi:hypothetical protein